MKPSDKRYLQFWAWFMQGGDDVDEPPGYKRIVDPWMLVHIGLGVLLAWVVPLTLSEAAAVVLFPLAGVLVGLSFAWGGNAVALLQTSEIEQFTSQHPGGIREYIFAFQLAILSLLGALVLWGFAGLKVFDLLDTPKLQTLYVVMRVITFTASSFAIRECWHVVNGAQVLLLIRNFLQGHEG